MSVHVKQMEGFSSLIYGLEPRVVLQAAIHVVRGNTENGAFLINNIDGLHPDCFLNVGQLIGSTENNEVLKWFNGDNTFVPVDIDHFFERGFLELNFTDPEKLSKLKFLDKIGIRGHNALFNEFPSKPYFVKHKKFKKYLAGCLENDDIWPKLSEEQLVSKKALLRMVSSDLDFIEQCRYPIDQMRGFQRHYMGLMTRATIQCLEDVQNYIDRLCKTKSKAALYIADIKNKHCCNGLPPEQCIHKAERAIMNTLDDFKQKNNSLTDYVVKEYYTNTGLTLPEPYKILIEKAIQESVIPGFVDYLCEVKKCLAHCTAHLPVGIMRIQSDQGLYDSMLRWHTTTNLSAEEIHMIGLEQVQMLKAKIEELLNRLKSDKNCPFMCCGNFNLNLQAALHHSTSFGAIDCLKSTMKDFTTRTLPYFNKLPNACCSIGELPGNMRGTMGYYENGTLDYSRSGTFLVKSDQVGRHMVKSLVAHEAVPGHHYQIQRLIENEELPYFRRCCEGCFTAFNEGWGLYAEWLCHDLGFYKDENGQDGFDTLGYYNFEMLRSCRLVVDTGLHHFGWSRQEAIDFMLQNSGCSEAFIEDEIDRYCIFPGQACSYKIGQLKFLEIRRRLEERPGFDLARFHDKLLDLGSLPLDVVEEEMMRWDNGIMDTPLQQAGATPAMQQNLC